LIIAGISLVVAILVLITSVCIWFSIASKPVSNDTTTKLVGIEAGWGPSQIAERLKDAGIIRSEEAFQFYVWWHHQGGKLQQGSYELAPNETLAEVVGHLTRGDVSVNSVTFVPGAMLDQGSQSIRDTLLAAGFSTSAIDTALARDYSADFPELFADKPSSANLEGYIWGDTYNYSSGASVESILDYTFSEFTKVVEQNDLVAKFRAQNLNLYQGITLASIIQREAGNKSLDDMRQVAQVFYSRLKIGMPLGSDVTAIYIAQQLGVYNKDSPQSYLSVDSPYNTRRYTGLTPGPIAVPGLNALKAAADPATTNYLYFITGDDGEMYFALDQAGHEQNVAKYCQQSCG